MTNPISAVKNTRVVYSTFLQKKSTGSSGSIQRRRSCMDSL